LESAIIPLIKGHCSHFKALVNSQMLGTDLAPRTASLPIRNGSRTSNSRADLNGLAPRSHCSSPARISHLGLEGTTGLVMHLGFPPLSAQLMVQQPRAVLELHLRPLKERRLHSSTVQQSRSLSELRPHSSTERQPRSSTVTMQQPCLPTKLHLPRPTERRLHSHIEHQSSSLMVLQPGSSTDRPPCLSTMQPPRALSELYLRWPTERRLHSSTVWRSRSWMELQPRPPTERQLH
jgi:hypothetical protein